MLWVEVVFDVVENIVIIWCKVCRKIEQKEIVGSKVDSLEKQWLKVVDSIF